MKITKFQETINPGANAQWYYLPPNYIAPEILDLSGMSSFSINGDLDVFGRPITYIGIRSVNGTDTYKVRALLDTGSPYNVISSKLVDKIGLDKISDAQSISVMGLNSKGEYSAIIMFSNDISFECKLRTFNVEWDSVDVLIGTAFLSHCKFLYNEPVGKFSLKYQK